MKIDLQSPPLYQRIGGLCAAVGFCALPQNPLIHLGSWLGLSPAPWERFTGFKTVFSGMSEAFHRLAVGDVQGAFIANFLAPPFAILLTLVVLFWRWPRLTRRRDEVLFFAAIVIASIAVNIVHGT